ncbi:MAG: hypothetical protein ACKOWO_07035 [Sediminibacterium sp.]
MKQVLTILLLFVYSFSSIGATVKAHLCAGKVQKCFCGKSNKKDTCCAEKTTFIKKQDLHQSAELPVAKNPSFVATIPVDFYTCLATPFVPQKTKPQIYSKKGLLFAGPPIYVLDCLYLI